MTFDSSIEDLKNDTDWRKRRAAVYYMAEAVRQGQVLEKLDRPIVPELFLELASDPKWEVRKAVAENLSCVIQDEAVYSKIFSILKDDSNAFVKSAVKTAAGRSRHKQSPRSLKFDQDNEVRKIYGPEVLEKINELAQKHLDLVVGELTHDLRSIITSLRSNVLSLTKDRHSKNADAIKRQFEAFEHVLSDLKSYSEPVLSTPKLENLGDLVQIAADMAAIAIREQGYNPENVVIKSEINNKLKATVIRQPLILALNNLIKNAYESLLDDNNELRAGTIEITAVKIEKAVVITISDTGMGLSEAELQVLKSCVPGRKNKSKPNSTGFGFPLACKYIAAQGGAVDIESKEDKGTKVIITLKKYDAA